MNCPDEMRKTLTKYGWWERGNGTWSHEKDGLKHRIWDEVIRALIEKGEDGNARF